MEAALDEYWLSGDPAWRPLSKGESPSEWVDSEIDPNEEWSSWQRQRLQPMAARFVFGPAWSIGLLIASTFPLIFPGNTPDDQTVASLLFFSAFLQKTHPGKSTLFCAFAPFSSKKAQHKISSNFPAVARLDLHSKAQW